MKAVKINGTPFDAVTWKLGIKDNPAYHIPSSHGKNKIHKFTNSAKDKILSEFPLDMDGRKARIDEVLAEYTKALRS